MIEVQLNLYIFTYSKRDRDFDILSIDKDKLEVPSIEIYDSSISIKKHLDSLFEKVNIEYKPVYRLLNNILLDSVYHSIYFCVLPDSEKIDDDFYKLPVKNYAIYSPNIQQIMQNIR